MTIPTTIAAINQRGAPAIKLGGNAAYNPATASIATSGGHSGSRGWLLIARVITDCFAF